MSVLFMTTQIMQHHTTAQKISKLRQRGVR